MNVFPSFTVYHISLRYFKTGNCYLFFSFFSFLFFWFFFWGGRVSCFFCFVFSFLKTLSDRCVRLVHVVMMTVLLKVFDNIWRLLRLYHGFFLMKGSLLCLSGIIVIIVIRTHENEQLRPCFLMTF